MAKSIIPLKLVVEVGTGNALLLYKVNEDGQISQQRSVNVKANLDGDKVNAVLSDAIASANTSEGL